MTVDEVRRALDALNNAEPDDRPFHWFLYVGELRVLGYEGDAKPGDLIEFKGMTVRVMPVYLPNK